MGQEHNDKAVIAFDLAFRRRLPQHEASKQNAVTGNYEQAEGDAFDGKRYAIADGLYRVHGSEWLFTFKAGAFVEAERAMPPKFGGPKVIQVVSPEPGNPLPGSVNG